LKFQTKRDGPKLFACQTALTAYFLNFSSVCKCEHQECCCPILQYRTSPWWQLHPGDITLDTMW